MIELKNKHIVVTGAGRGLGRALALSFSRMGARVFIVSRNARELAEVTELIRSRGGIAHSYVADVADKNAVHAIATVAAELLGPVDGLVHNASTLGPVPLQRLVDTACEDLELALQVNVVGPFRLTKLIAGSMLVHNGGWIMQVSSDAAVNHYERWGAYAASKAAADHLTQTFAEEMRGSGVTFFSVDPGEMDTEMHAQAVPDADRAQLSRPEAVAEQLVHAISTREIRSGSRLVAPRFEVQS